MLQVHHGSTGGYVQQCPHAGNQADKRASVWNVTDHHGKWKERAWWITHWLLKLSTRGNNVISLLLITLAKTYDNMFHITLSDIIWQIWHMTISDIKIWKENEKKFTNSINDNLSVFDFLNSISSTQELWSCDDKLV